MEQDSDKNDIVKGFGNQPLDDDMIAEFGHDGAVVRGRHCDGDTRLCCGATTVQNALMEKKSGA